VPVQPLPLLADALPPPLSWHQFGVTQIDFASVLIAAAGLLYALGVVRVRRLRPDQPWSMKRVIAFYGGLAVTFVAVEAFVGVYDDVLFYDHMIQHLLLIMVAAPLFAMGAPIELLERSTTGTTHRVVERGLSSKIAEVVAHPIVDFALYAIIIPVAHLTSFYNLTLENEQVHDLEHLLFLVIGYLFWRHVVAIEPSRHRLHPGVRLLYLALAVPVDTFTGLSLASATHELFPAYLALHRPWGPGLVGDLHLGGAVMWIGGDSLMTLAIAPVAVQWVRHEERKALEVDRALGLIE
jgi:cytochrome c oxidase assembly factor CtaG